MKNLRPIFKCHGGKGYTFKWIIANFPKEFNHYVEGCGGAASVLLNKPPSETEVYNDADPYIANIFEHLQNETFLAQIQAAPYTEATFNQAKEKTSEFDLEGAVSELIVRRMSRGGMRKAFSWSERLRGGRPGDLNAWETFKEHLPLIIQRLKDVQIKCMMVADLVKEHDSEDTFFYIDPPYLPTTRQSNNVYSVEMNQDQHVELLDTINAVKGKVLVSGYDSPLYEKMLAGWNSERRMVANHSAQTEKKQKRIEVLWRNY